MSEGWKEEREPCGTARGEARQQHGRVESEAKGRREGNEEKETDTHRQTTLYFEEGGKSERKERGTTAEVGTKGLSPDRYSDETISSSRASRAASGMEAAYFAVT
jgi:hypothetical protein